MAAISYVVLASWIFWESLLNDLEGKANNHCQLIGQLSALCRPLNKAFQYL
jgi:hypothetical protein